MTDPASKRTDPTGKRPLVIANLRENHGEILAMLSDGQQQQQQQRQQTSGGGGGRPPSPSPRGSGTTGAAMSAATPGAVEDYTYNNYTPGSDGKCARCGQAGEALQARQRQLVLPPC